MKKELTTVIMVMVDGKVKPLEDYAQHPDEVKELAKI